jgi:hypothetical protein
MPITPRPHSSVDTQQQNFKYESDVSNSPPPSYCTVCSKHIEKERITFEDQTYDKNCFRCASCSTDLWRMKKAIRHPNGGPSLFCEPCHTRLFAHRCEKCKDPIHSYMSTTTFEDKIYHKECFTCSRCKKRLRDIQVFKSGNRYICKDCFK